LSPKRVRSRFLNGLVLLEVDEIVAAATFGVDHLSVSCNSNTNCTKAFGTGSYGWTAFAMTAGEGFDIKLNKKIALLVQAEYLD